MRRDEQIAEYLPLLLKRNEIKRAIRQFFEERDYWEVETPYLVPTPGEEVHLRCFRTILEQPDGVCVPRFLHTSPEFAMKRLLAATRHSLFQFARVWRNGEKSATHRPEFTMLEWYRPHASLSSLMDETQSLLKAVLPPSLPWQKRNLNGGEVQSGLLDLTQDFERLTMQEAFRQYVGVDLLEHVGNAEAFAREAGVALRMGETWEDLFFRLLLEKIEPHIGHNRPIFLTHWPAEQAALSRLCPEDSRVALRFELYAGGLELANAFEELTDPQEQRRRFELDRQKRQNLYLEIPAGIAGHDISAQDWPIDEIFLAALAQMPPCAGIALGFDRLVMLATSAPDIEAVQWL